MLECLNATGFLSFANVSVAGSLTYEENRKQVHFRGYKVMDIAPGCVLYAQGITFVSAFDPVLHYPTITSRFSPPQSIVDHFANHSSQITEALSHFNFVDYNALVEGGRSSRTCRCGPLLLQGSSDFSGGSLIGAFSLAAVVVYLARGRILSCLLERHCPRVVDGLAIPLKVSAA